MRKLPALILVLAACASTPVYAAPPYDMTIAFTPAPGALSHRAYMRCKPGETRTLISSNLANGQMFPEILPAQGEYSVCVHGVFAGNVEGPAVMQVFNVTENGPPTNLVITITCPAANCSITTTTVP